MANLNLSVAVMNSRDNLARVLPDVFRRNTCLNFIKFVSERPTIQIIHDQVDIGIVRIVYDLVQSDNVFVISFLQSLEFRRHGRLIFGNKGSLNNFHGEILVIIIIICVWHHALNHLARYASP
jgi:hypothetical protein